jgi:replicative DNA helicase
VTQQVTFGQYGRSFQEKIVQALLVDKQFAEQMVEVVDVSYFDLRYLSFLAERYFQYAKKYKVFPTLNLLITIIRDDLKTGNDVVLRDQIVEYLQRIRSNPDLGDLEYVKEKSLDFCRKQALKAALEQAVDHIASEKYEQIVETIKKAVTVGTSPAMGHDFFEDYEARFTTLRREAVPTGLAELDAKEILNGGLGRGEIGVVVAPTGVGKSHFLTMLGANAMRAGVNVLHYTFELSENQVGLRYDSNLCDIDSSDICENKDKVLAIYKDNKLGRLKIKEYPTNTASIYTIRSHVERLTLRGFKPGMIVIDYADIMRSTRQFDSLRHELKLVYEELRGYAQEQGIPIWTASQSNKEGSDTDVVDLNNMSEAYGKAMVADVVVTISRRSHEKSTGLARIYLAKNRAGRDGLLYNAVVNTARSQFLIENQSTKFEAAQGNQDEMKAMIRDKWNELKEAKLVEEKKKSLKNSNDVSHETDDEKSPETKSD